MVSLFTFILLYSTSVFAQQTTGIINYQFIDELTSPITGVVKKVAKVGRLYPYNSHLVEFDPTLINSKFKSLKQTKEKNKKVLAEAERELQRSVDLYEGTMLSDHELKLAEIKVSKAQADLAEVEHKLTKAHWKKRYYHLQAPYDGYLIETNLYPGKYLASRYNAAVLLGFVKANSVQFSIQLAQNAVPVVGNEIKVSAMGETFKGKIIAVVESNSKPVLHAQLISQPESLPRQGSVVTIESN